MIKPNNPFLISEYLSPEYFCDRQQETAELLNNLHNGWSVTMIAPRRMGKTGLIKNAFYLLKEQQPDIHTYYIDIMGTQCLNDFIQMLGSAVLGTLDSDWQKALKHVSEIVRSCKPSVVFDEQSGAPRISIDVSMDQQDTTLREICDYLRQSEKTCYIAIDEFQRLAEYPEKGAEALLRSQIQFLPNVKFIFAGSQRHMLESMFNDTSRPFYRSTRTASLGPIAEETYYDFAAQFFTEQGRPLPQEVFHFLYHRVYGHTWYVQALLKELYSYYQPIDQELLDRAFRSLMMDNSSFYEFTFNHYTLTMRRVMKAIAKEQLVKEVSSAAFIQKYNLKAASSVSTALRSLTEDDIVCKSPEGYRLYDPFYAAWLRQLG